MTQPTPDTGVPTCYRHPGRESYIRCQRCDRTICPDCMRDAAVGFQCVECVKKGSKETRSGRTAYGGRRSSDPTATTVALMAVNIGVWIAVFASGGFSSRLFDWLALRPDGYCLTGGFVDNISTRAECGAAAWNPGVADGAYWQLVTSMFTHVEIWHIAFNMFALWTFGPQIEALFGRVRFLALYFLSGLAGSAVVLWAGSQFGGTHGASGALFGLMAARLVVALKARGDVTGIATWLVASFFGTWLLIQNVSWQGHLGGALGGAAVAAVLAYAPIGPRRTSYQVAGLVGIALLVALAIVTRVAALS